jgi:hypothetical protein
MALTGRDALSNVNRPDHCYCNSSAAKSWFREWFRAILAHIHLVSKSNWSMTEWSSKLHAHIYGVQAHYSSRSQGTEFFVAKGQHPIPGFPFFSKWLQLINRDRQQSATWCSYLWQMTVIYKRRQSWKSNGSALGQPHISLISTGHGPTAI